MSQSAEDKKIQERLEYGREYYRKNREKMIAYSTQYRKDHPESKRRADKRYREKHKEKLAKRDKLYYEKNKEEIRAKQKAYYEANKERILKQNKKYADDHRGESREYLKKRYAEQRALSDSIKAENGCLVCGIDVPVVLDFHHVDPAEKVDSVSNLVCAKKQKLLDEIEKCVILCANCHRIFHYLDDMENEE
jgi:hypothetical protein